MAGTRDPGSAYGALIVTVIVVWTSADRPPKPASAPPSLESDQVRPRLRPRSARPSGRGGTRPDQRIVPLTPPHRPWPVFVHRYRLLWKVRIGLQSVPLTRAVLDHRRVGGPFGQARPDHVLEKDQLERAAQRSVAADGDVQRTRARVIRAAAFTQVDLARAGRSSCSSS